MRKKILSLALACLMIMTVFATAIPVFAVGNVCSVTIDSSTEYYSSFDSAFKAAYSSTNNGKEVIIEFLADITAAETISKQNCVDGSHTSYPTILVKGNDKTLTTTNTPFVMECNGKLTVENLNIVSGDRFASLGRGAVAEFSSCTFVSTGAGNGATTDGHSSGNNAAYFLGAADNSKINTLTITESEIEITNETSTAPLFAAQDGSKCLLVKLDNVTAELNETAPSVMIMQPKYNNYQKDMFVANDTTITVGAEHGFDNINRGDVKLSGTTSLTTTHENGVMFYTVSSSTNTWNVYVDDEAKIVAKTLASCTVTTNIYTTNPNFFSDSAFTAPTLEDGASVRTTQDTDGEGLRFTANIAKDTTAKEYGIIAAATTNELTSDNFTMAALGEGKYVKVASTDDGFKKDDSGDAVVYNAVLTGIAETSKNYSARAYATYEYATNVNITVYSAYDANVNSRNVKQVATLAYNDLLTQAEIDAKLESGDLTAAEAAQYTCTVGDKLSRYGTEQRKVLAKIAGISTEA